MYMILIFLYIIINVYNNKYDYYNGVSSSMLCMYV